MADSPFKINDIPPMWASFIGRDIEREQLRDFLDNSKSPILLVYGLRGVGKSSLVCYAANEFKDKFSSVVWVDRTNALELFKDMDDDFLVSINGPKKNGDHSVKSRRKNEEINPIVSAAKKALLNKSSELPFLLVVDDFDEEYSLLETKNDELALCGYIERFVGYPNKIIITSRLRENSFKGLGYDTLEIGLLQKQDVDVLVKKHLGKLDTSVLVNANLEDTCEFIWNMSGGLAEFVSRCIIPVATQRELLLGRDPRYAEIIQEFSQCYLLEREQPRSIEGYEVTLTSQVLESRLVSLFSKDSFSEFVLWKWLKLNLTDGYLEDDLGIILGLNMQDGSVAAKFRNALMELHKYRFIARQIEIDASKVEYPKKLTKWILLPIISSYLQKYWPTYRQYWNDEAIYLHNFVEAHINIPSKTVLHFERILSVINWCYDNQSWNNLISLGISASKASEKIIETGEIPQNLSALTLIDICKKTADALEKQVESESWMFLIKVLLILAKLYSSEKINGGQLLARDYAVKALDLAIKKQSPEEFDAIVLTAKMHIYLGELEKADELLEKVCKKGGIKDDWAVTAFLLATILRRDNEGSPNRSYFWYRKIIDSVNMHKKVDIALQSAIDASKYCASIENPDDILDVLVMASELLKQKSENVRKYPFLSIQVLAHCAAAYEKRKDFDVYKSLLQDAKQHCKEFGFEQHPVFDNINNRLVYLAQKDLGTSLFDDLVTSTSQEPDILYGFDELFTNCPVCRKRLSTGKEIISCDSCGNAYHKVCLMDANLFSCPSCNIAFNLLKKEQLHGSS